MKRSCLLLACSIACYTVTGCGPAATPPAKSPIPAASGDHGHDHSADAGDHGHDHPAHGAGPHDGTLTDWGGGAYHIEFTVDHDKKEATVYIVGSDEKSPAPIKAEKINLVINDPMTELDLVAQPLEGETDGMSSRFVGTHDTLGIVKEFSGTISGEVEGTPYTGDFKEEAHLDHEHGDHKH